MNRSYLRTALIATVVFAMFAGTAFGQGDLIGRRGGLLNPPTGTTPTLPVLPPTLNLPDTVESSLLKGLNSSGTALRPGMGWLVSDLTHQGIHGRELADIIHQLKPYKQRGVLTFPQPPLTQPPQTLPGGTTPTGTPQNPPVFQRRDDDDRAERRGFDDDKHGDKHNGKHVGVGVGGGGNKGGKGGKKK